MTQHLIRRVTLSIPAVATCTCTTPPVKRVAPYHTYHSINNYQTLSSNSSSTMYPSSAQHILRACNTVQHLIATMGTLRVNSTSGGTRALSTSTHTDYSSVLPNITLFQNALKHL